MKLRILVCFLLLTTALLAQDCIRPGCSNLTVTGDAEVKVAPDRVTIIFGVNNRDLSLRLARTKNDTATKAVLAAMQRLGVEPGDMQTDYINISIGYDSSNPTVITHYNVQKNISILSLIHI